MSLDHEVTRTREYDGMHARVRWIPGDYVVGHVTPLKADGMYEVVEYATNADVDQADKIQHVKGFENAISRLTR